MVYAPGPAESYSVEFPELYLSAKEVLLDGKKDSEVQLDIVTNQIPVSIHVPSDAASWLSVELSGDKILCKALADNEADDSRMATVTITAGAESISLAVTQNGTSVIGQVWGTEGVIFWENPDKPGEYKIVSAKAEKRPWGPAGATVGVNSSSIDGLTAAAKMRAMPDYTTASYAQQFCDALGDDWYLPNRSEGDALFLAYDGQTYFAKDGSGTATKDVPNNCTAAEKARRAAFDWALTSLPNGVALNTQDGSQNGDSIWLCYETSSGNGYYYRYGSPGCSYGTKSSTNRFARCVKVVQSE